jgi:glycosyltransferase involved in cell wall biosynthesis
LRILWYSNAPWVGTGYGQQTAIQVPKLQSLGHDVAVAAFHGLQGVPLQWGGMTVYPGSSEDSWAQDVMLGHYQQHKSDLLISLMDAWVLSPEKLGEQINRGMRVAHWMPVDCEPLGSLDERILELCGGRPIAMSRHGERQLAKFEPLYVPHSIDTSVFVPVSDELRRQSRTKGGFEDKFVIGINAANQDPVRKGFGEQLAAFRLLADRHPDVAMLIHTRKVTRSGGNLDRIVEVLHLQGLVHFGDQYLTVSGLTTQAEIARWYAVCDIVSNCSYGEGFGLPILEAQAAGTPVVVTDASAMTELCGAGWLVEGEFYWNAGHSAWWTRPSVQGILAAYEQAYQERGTPEAAARRVAAREFALQYDADLVLREYWEPVLDELEGVAGTDKHAGLRWLPDSLAHDDATEQAVLDLIPEGGVFADAMAGPGHYALLAARKASRVVAATSDERLRFNMELNNLTNVEIQGELDISAEPFVDVLRCSAGGLIKLRDMVTLHQPVVVIADGKGKGDMFREWLKKHGYEFTSVSGSRCVIAVRP